MSHRVLVVARARRDIDAAYEWLAARAPARADAWREGLFEAIRSLGRDPSRCPRLPEAPGREFEFRQLLYGPRSGRYRIVFLVHEDAVYVLHVRHGARDRLRGPEVRTLRESGRRLRSDPR